MNQKFNRVIIYLLLAVSNIYSVQQDNSLFNLKRLNRFLNFIEPDAIKFSPNRTPQVNNQMLPTSTSNNNSQEVQNVLPKRVDISAQEMLENSIQKNDSFGVQTALSQGADAITPDNRGVTPLFRTISLIHPYNRLARNAQTEIVELLLKNGANANSQNTFGETPLIEATCKPNSDSIVQLLLKNGADANGQDRNGNAPLTVPIDRQYENVVRLLLEHGANPNTQNVAGQSSLMVTIYKRNKNIVQLLLQAGADVNAQDTFGETPLIAAVYNNSEPIVQLLLQAGADVNGQSRLGITPLSAATHTKNERIVQLLLQAGATPTEAAAITVFKHFQNRDVVKLLMQKTGTGIGTFAREYLARIGRLPFIQDIIDEINRESNT